MRVPISIVVLTIGFLSTSYHQAAMAQEVRIAASRQIEDLIERINTDKIVLARISFAAQLRELVRNYDQETLDGLDVKVVEGMASLLMDEDDFVRSEIATALGYMGPSALRAAPALLKALKDSQVKLGTSYVNISSVDMIVSALIRLKVCTPVENVYPRNACNYLLH